MENLSVECKVKIINICTNLINNDINLIYGCRELITLKKEYELNDRLFDSISGVVSETDDYPDILIRVNFHEDYLKELDMNIQDYIDLVRAAIVESCKKLIQAYGY